MTKLEIPEGYSKGTYEVRESAFPCGYLVNAQDGFTEATAQLIMLAPAMAEEIKRLRSELESARASLSHFEALAQSRYLTILDMQNERESRSPATREDRAFQCLQGLLAAVGGELEDYTSLERTANMALNQADAMLAALAKPQGAQEASGFEKPYVPVATAMGVEPAQTRRPFNLAAALRGEKVVTRDGKPATNFRQDPEPDEQSGYRWLADIDGEYFHYKDNGKGGLGEWTHDLFMEGGV